MADAMGLGEYLRKEIPVFLRQEVLGKGDLPGNPAQQSIAEFAQLLCRPVGIAEAALRVLAEAGDDLLRQ
jgi:hypothetical protein